MPTDTEYLSMKTYLAYNVVSHLVHWLSCCLVTRVDAPFPSSGDPSELLVSSQTLARSHTSPAKSEHCTQGFQCTVSCKYIYRSAVHSGYCRIQDGWLMVRMGSLYLPQGLHPPAPPNSTMLIIICCILLWESSSFWYIYIYINRIIF